MHLFADMALTMPDMTTSTAPCVLCVVLTLILKYVHQKGGMDWLASILGILSAPAAPAVPANPSPANPVGQGGTVAEIEADLVALKARIAAMKGQVNPVAPPAVAV